MKLSEFKFSLPSNLIASQPTKNRDESRLMVLHRKTQTIEHRIFKDVLHYFEDGDAFIFNNTKVFPARMYGNKEKTGAKIEVFLLRELNQQMRLWDVLVDPARKIRVGNKLYFGPNDSLVAEVIDNTTSRGRTIRFLFDGSDEDFKAILFQFGETPIPRILGREPIEEDTERYQTVFAKQIGAVSAPAAGLHFSRELMKRLEIKGINFAEVTLHNSLAGFRPVEVEDLTKHKSESESFNISEEACKIVNKTLDNGKQVCVVGTSTLRAVETSVSANKRLKPAGGWTDKFIFYPYEFQIPSALITNFHLPESTLLMSASAFAGHEFLLKAYSEAIKEGYRFFAYGDAMLIL